MDPIPKGKVRTVPEMLLAKPATWQDDLDAVGELMARDAAEGATPPHPSFGPLSHREWCILAAKHIDHHLRQFGL